MCGIAGFFGDTNRIDEDRISSCKNIMKRRGPDNNGIFKDDKLLLLHSRLSIIDLTENGNQPFEDTNTVFAMNGELYNYKEIRKTQVIENKSDAKVMWKHLSFHNSLQKLEGMWAFALYEKRTKKLQLCRDRFGEKPLYIYRKDNGIYFGSQISFIKELSGDKLEVNYDRLLSYMVNGYRSLFKDRRQTFFKDVEAIEPGYYLTFKNKNGKIKEEENIYYFNKNIKKENDMSDNEILGGIESRIYDIVETRLRSDVPIAFCMSGGVDSNALISVAKIIYDYDVHGFTIHNGDQRYNEDHLVDASVKYLGINHTYVNFNSYDFLSNLRKQIKSNFSPVSTISYYIHRLLSKEIARQGYKVVISGTAGDEIFSGYYDHFIYHLLSNNSLRDWENYVKPYIRNPILKDIELFKAYPHYRKYLYYGAENYLITNWRSKFYEEKFTDNILRNRMLNELYYEAVPIPLYEDDLNSMYYSIENRTPFLDTSLIDFMQTVPSKKLIQNGYGKYLLREAMHGIVCDEVRLNRQKYGFNAPIYDLLNIGENYDWIVNDSAIYDLIDKEKIIGLFNKKELIDNEAKFIFNFINAKIFLEEF